MSFYTVSVRPYHIELIRRDYTSNEGWETFLSYEDPQQDILVGLLRLRKCSEGTFRPELIGGVSIIRELHVYGSVVPVSGRYVMVEISSHLCLFPTFIRFTGIRLNFNIKVGNNWPFSTFQAYFIQFLLKVLVNF